VWKDKLCGENTENLLIQCIVNIISTGLQTVKKRTSLYTDITDVTLL